VGAEHSGPHCNETDEQREHHVHECSTYPASVGKQEWSTENVATNGSHSVLLRHCPRVSDGILVGVIGLSAVLASAIADDATTERCSWIGVAMRHAPKSLDGASVEQDT
jgi:hypothetical protein